MKKVLYFCSHLTSVTNKLLWHSCPVLRLNVQQRSGSTMSTESANTRLNNLFSSTRARLIVERHIEGMLGLFVGRQHSARPFSCAGDGENTFIHISFFLTPPSFSVLPAISHSDGIVHCEVVEGSFCAESFQRFISRLLNQMEPFPAPNSVVVMDNCRIHKSPDVVEMIESRFVLQLLS